MVTAATYQKAKLFHDQESLEALCGGLLKYSGKHNWSLHAWAVFPNHYHFIAKSPPDDAASLKKFLMEFHSRSARWLNARDSTPGRKVWHNYAETKLTYEASYFARLKYVHQNPVKHGLVEAATEYPWCSASWFEKTATSATKETVASFKTDTLKIEDDF